jgi:hypothetical protein
VELNKRTKLVGGLLAFALAGLIFDRVIGYGPKVAQAAPAPEAAAAPPREAPRLATGKGSQHHGALTARLKAIGGSRVDSPQRDNAFIAPVAWFPPDEEVVQQKQAEAKKAQRQHHLTTVLSSKDRGIYAVRVDGKLLRRNAPELVESAEGKYKLEFIAAEYDDKTGVTRVEVLVDGDPLTLFAGNKDKEVRETDQSGGR